MIVRLIGPEWTLMDQEAIAAWAGRSQSTVSRRCTPIACDTNTRRLLYHAEAAWKQLEALQRRPNAASGGA